MHPALLIVICLCSTAAAQYWNTQRDDLAEYQLDKSALAVRSESECAGMSESKHQAVQFSSSDGTCCMWICQLGATGCRKCRNARNSSLPALLVRVLQPLTRSCWRTFQHRVDGSVDFYRNWTDYVSGFGQGEERNYWMGLEAIHLLTQAGDRRVRWETSMWNGSWWWWENQAFAVQGAGQGYRVTVGSADPNASTIMLAEIHPMNNQMFSTSDRDQDSHSSAFCAQTFHSGWWHNECHNFNPNGMYFTPPTALQLTIGTSIWATGLSLASSSNSYPFNYEYSMKTFEGFVTDVAPDL